MSLRYDTKTKWRSFSFGLEKHGLDARFSFPQNKKTVYQNTKQRGGFGTGNKGKSAKSSRNVPGF